MVATLEYSTDPAFLEGDKSAFRGAQYGSSARLGLSAGEMRCTATRLRRRNRGLEPGCQLLSCEPISCGIYCIARKPSGKEPVILGLEGRLIVLGIGLREVS
jgi:hypothetical protein